MGDFHPKAFTYQNLFSENIAKRRIRKTNNNEGLLYAGVTASVLGVASHVILCQQALRFTENETEEARIQRKSMPHLSTRDLYQSQLLSDLHFSVQTKKKEYVLNNTFLFLN